MPREKKYIAIILKKTQFAEADEIVTAFTKEAGKIRFLAKSSKLSKSKLAHALQNLFLVDIVLAGGQGKSLPKIISGQVIKSFPNLRENLEKCGLALYASELVYKFMPDEQPNKGIFNLLFRFLGMLDLKDASFGSLKIYLAKFKIDFLEILGLGIQANLEAEQGSESGFSNSAGGFVKKGSGQDTKTAPLKALQQFILLKKTPFEAIDQDLLYENIDVLQQLLTGFLEYQLERTIHSEKLL